MLPADKETLKKYLDIFLFTDAAVIASPEDDWLRMIRSGISEDGVLWYYFQNGSGDEMQIFFSQAGIAVKGFDHENELNQFAAEPPNDTFFPRLYHGVPEELLHLFTEDELETATFFLWKQNHESDWHQNEFPGNDGGKAYLLDYIPQSAEDFLEWARDYYHTAIDADIIQNLYTSGAFTRDAALKLNPDCNPEAVLAELH